MNAYRKFWKEILYLTELLIFYDTLLTWLYCTAAASTETLSSNSIRVVYNIATSQLAKTLGA